MSTTNEDSILEKLIEALVSEALRGFNLEKFKSFKVHQERLQYAESLLPKMGQGSARVVFAYSTGKVLKIARNVRGIAQNEAELDIFTDPNTKPVVARIFDADTSKHIWLLSEIVKPLPKSDEAAWEKATGLPWDRFSSFMREWNYDDNPDIDQWFNKIINEYAEYTDSTGEIEYWAATKIDILKKLQAHSLVRGVMHLIQQGLEPGDLINSPWNIGHYGVAIDGRVVVLDYGFTEDVADNHY